METRGPDYKPPTGSKPLKFKRIGEPPNVYELEDGSRIYLLHFAKKIYKLPEGSYAMEVDSDVKHFHLPKDNEEG